ncbi:MAG: glycosyl hydrolase family 18 protein [Lachnospiraceae bacterium]|nr:glycosyl hydrolase family 18 protein [Lachnospiraceae bacterium]
MKKIIPVLIAIVLIVIIAVSTFGAKIYERYSYSQERADLYEYFDLYSDTDMAIFVQNERLPQKAQYVNGEVYFDLDFVHEQFNPRFYLDESEELLLFTTPTEIIKTAIGTDSYQVTQGVTAEGEPAVESRPYTLCYRAGETVYVAAKWVAEHSSLSYETFTEPNRMELKTGAHEYTRGVISSNTAVRHRGGVKSPILTDISEGEEVVVIEQMEEWSKVKTKDCFIGYVENKRLKDIETATSDETPSTYVEPVYPNISKDYKINLVWHQIYAPQDGSSLKEALSGTSGINTVSPTVFSLSDNEGNFTSIATRDYVDTAHAMGIEVWALIDNFNEAVSTQELLSSMTARENLRRNIVNAVKEYGFDGINIDFEQVPMQAGLDFIQFIRELSVDCRLNQIILSIDNYVPTEYTDHYDRAEQGKVADYVIIMGYDEHYSGSDAGSVASIDFVSGGIADTVSKVPEEKVINALPYYTRIWKTEGGNVTCEAVGMGAAKNFLSQNGVEAAWDEATCQNYAEFQKGDVFYQVWLEDEESIQTKLNVMNQYKLAGVAGWKLGLEKAYVWDLIGGYLEQ